MHELAITQSVVDAIVERTGPARVNAVRLVIGRLSGVVPESIRFCFDLVTADTPLAGAALTIDEPAGRARRPRCGAEFVADDILVLCDCDCDCRWTAAATCGDPPRWACCPRRKPADAHGGGD